MKKKTNCFNVRKLKKLIPVDVNVNMYVYANNNKFS